MCALHLKYCSTTCSIFRYVPCVQSDVYG
jgi:hypothetical protein